MAADTPETLDAWVRHWAALEPQRLALVVDDDTLTFGELALLSGKAAAWLAEQGVGPGDRLALWGQNSLAWVIWQVAAAWRGAATVALHPGLPAPELQQAVRQAQPHWLIVDPWIRGVASGQIADELGQNKPSYPGLRGVTVMSGEDGRPDWQALSGQEAVPPAPVGDPEAALTLQFTSGSSGRSKLVMLSHQAVLENARVTALAADIAADDRVISPLPLFHSAGISSGLSLCLRLGALWCSTPRFRPDGVVAQMARWRGTVLQGVPTMFKGVLQHPDTPKAAASLRTGFIGGAACSPALCDEIVRSLPLERLCVVYGQTEFGPTISIASLAPGERLTPGQVGEVISGAELVIADPETGAPRPAGEAGEILVRGPTCMLGYFQDAEATAATVDATGWLHTGDLGFVSGRNLYLIDRLKFMIIRGGENVPPTEVEECLREVVDVRDACVVPVPSDHWGEAICAVILHDPGVAPEVDGLRQHCTERLSRFKRPDCYLMLTELPLLPSGKIDRRAVQALAIERSGHDGR